MDGGEATERALQPEDLDRLFLERANAGDVDEFGRAAGEGHWVVVCPGRIATAMR